MNARMPRGGIHISQCNHDFAGQRSVSDSYSETAGWMAALPLAERSFTRKGKKNTSRSKPADAMVHKAKTKREGIT